MPIRQEQRSDKWAAEANGSSIGAGLRPTVTAIAVGLVALSLAALTLVDASYRFVAAALLVGLAGLVAHVAVGRLLRPLGELHEGLERIGRGKLTVPVPAYERSELGQLADHVNELAVQLRKSRKRTESREQAMITTLGKVAEGRSRESANHMLRVGAMSAELALLAGLSREEAEILRVAAPLHDLGKVGIPDAILTKPSKFTPREFAVMKSHAELGHRILAGSRTPSMRAAATVALTHHERWDGRGYPRGISGEEIPIYGRIVGLVDTFDAVFSDRAYRKAMSHDKGLGIITSQRGHHFDPRLVDLFVENLPVFTAIIEQYKDAVTAEPRARAIVENPPLVKQTV